MIGLGVPPGWRHYFLLLRQKKVSKEKATLGRRRAAPGPLRYSVRAGAAELGLRPQTVLALIRSNLRCSATPKGAFSYVPELATGIIVNC